MSKLPVRCGNLGFTPVLWMAENSKRTLLGLVVCAHEKEALGLLQRGSDASKQRPKGAPARHLARLLSPHWLAAGWLGKEGVSG